MSKASKPISLEKQLVRALQDLDFDKVTNFFDQNPKFDLYTILEVPSHRADKNVTALTLLADDKYFSRKIGKLDDYTKIIELIDTKAKEQNIKHSDELLANRQITVLSMLIFNKKYDEAQKLLEQNPALTNASYHLGQRKLYSKAELEAKIAADTERQKKASEELEKNDIKIPNQTNPINPELTTNQTQNLLEMTLQEIFIPTKDETARLNFVKYLINKGLEINFEKLVAAEVPIELYEMIIKKDPTCLDKVTPKVETKEMYQTITSGQDTTLHLAAAGGNFELFKLILEKKPELLNKKNCQNITIFDIAAENKDLQIIRFVIENKPASIDYVNTSGDTMLHIAASIGDLELFKLILEKKPELLTQLNNEGKTVLHSAAESGNLDLIKFIIEKNSNLINIVDKYKSNILHLIINERDKIKNSYEIAKHLINETNIDINAQHNLATSEYALAMLCDKLVYQNTITIPQVSDKNFPAYKEYIEKIESLIKDLLDRGAKLDPSYKEFKDKEQLRNIAFIDSYVPKEKANSPSEPKPKQPAPAVISKEAETNTAQSNPVPQPDSTVAVTATTSKPASPLPGTSNLTGAALLQEILDGKLAIDTLKNKSYYEILSVEETQDLSINIVKETYKNLSKGFHPDRIKTNDPEKKKRSEEIFKFISASYETLCDSQKKAEYYNSRNQEKVQEYSDKYSAINKQLNEYIFKSEFNNAENLLEKHAQDLRNYYFLWTNQYNLLFSGILTNQWFSGEKSNLDFETQKKFLSLIIDKLGFDENLANSSLWRTKPPLITAIKHGDVKLLEFLIVKFKEKNNDPEILVNLLENSLWEAVNQKKPNLEMVRFLVETFEKLYDGKTKELDDFLNRNYTGPIGIVPVNLLHILARNMLANSENQETEAYNNQKLIAEYLTNKGVVLKPFPIYESNGQQKDKHADYMKRLGFRELWSDLENLTSEIATKSKETKPSNEEIEKDIFLAAQYGDLELVEKLLVEGKDFRAIDGKRTIIHCALENINKNNKSQILESLLNTARSDVKYEVIKIISGDKNLHLQLKKIKPAIKFRVNIQENIALTLPDSNIMVQIKQLNQKINQAANKAAEKLEENITAENDIPARIGAITKEIKEFKGFVDEKKAASLNEKTCSEFLKMIFSQSKDYLDFDKYRKDPIKELVDAQLGAVIKELFDNQSLKNFKTIILQELIFSLSSNDDIKIQNAFKEIIKTQIKALSETEKKDFFSKDFFKKLCEQSTPETPAAFLNDELTIFAGNKDLKIPAIDFDKSNFFLSAAKTKPVKIGLLKYLGKNFKEKITSLMKFEYTTKREGKIELNVGPLSIAGLAPDAKQDSSSEAQLQSLLYAFLFSDFKPAKTDGDSLKKYKSYVFGSGSLELIKTLIEKEGIEDNEVSDYLSKTLGIKDIMGTVLLGSGSDDNKIEILEFLKNKGIDVTKDLTEDLIKDVLNTITLPNDYHLVIYFLENGKHLPLTRYQNDEYNILFIKENMAEFGADYQIPSVQETYPPALNQFIIDETYKRGQKIDVNTQYDWTLNKMILDKIYASGNYYPDLLPDQSYEVNKYILQKLGKTQFGFLSKVIRNKNFTEIPKYLADPRTRWTIKDDTKDTRNSLIIELILNTIESDSKNSSNQDLLKITQAIIQNPKLMADISWMEDIVDTEGNKRHLLQHIKYPESQSQIETLIIKHIINQTSELGDSQKITKCTELLTAIFDKSKDQNYTKESFSQDLKASLEKAGIAVSDFEIKNEPLTITVMDPSKTRAVSQSLVNITMHLYADRYNETLKERFEEFQEHPDNALNYKDRVKLVSRNKLVEFKAFLNQVFTSAGITSPVSVGPATTIYEIEAGKLEIYQSSSDRMLLQNHLVWLEKQTGVKSMKFTSQSLDTQQGGITERGYPFNPSVIDHFLSLNKAPYKEKYDQAINLLGQYREFTDGFKLGNFDVVDKLRLSHESLDTDHLFFDVTNIESATVQAFIKQFNAKEEKFRTKDLYAHYIYIPGSFALKHLEAKNASQKSTITSITNSEQKTLPQTSTPALSPDEALKACFNKFSMIDNQSVTWKDVKAALNAGANPNLMIEITHPNKTKEKVPVIWLAARSGNLEVVNILIEKKAIINTPTAHFGNTAFTTASSKGHIAVMEALLKAGANINHADKGGRTALDDATNNNNKTTLNWLKEHGVVAKGVSPATTKPIILEMQEEKNKAKADKEANAKAANLIDKEKAKYQQSKPSTTTSPETNAPKATNSSTTTGSAEPSATLAPPAKPNENSKEEVYTETISTGKKAFLITARIVLFFTGIGIIMEGINLIASKATGVDATIPAVQPKGESFIHQLYPAVGHLKDREALNAPDSPPPTAKVSTPKVVDKPKSPTWWQEKIGKANVERQNTGHHH